MTSTSQSEDLSEFASETFRAATTVGVSDDDGTELALGDTADGDGVTGLGLAELAFAVGEVADDVCVFTEARVAGACAGVLRVIVGAGGAGLDECVGCFQPCAYSLNAIVTKSACS